MQFTALPCLSVLCCPSLCTIIMLLHDVSGCDFFVLRREERWGGHRDYLFPFEIKLYMGGFLEYRPLSSVLSTIFKRHKMSIKVFCLFVFQNAVQEMPIPVPQLQLSVSSYATFKSRAWCNLSPLHCNKLITQLSHYDSFPRPFALLCVPSVVYCFVFKPVSYFLLQHYVFSSFKYISSFCQTCFFPELFLLWSPRLSSLFILLQQTQSVSCTGT